MLQHCFYYRHTSAFHTTTFSSDGGGGSSLMPVRSLPASSILVDVTPIEADTQVKNLEMVLLSAVSRLTTFSVICFSRLASAPAPAAQATVYAVLRFLNSSKPACQSSVGIPSVIMNTSGFQSPFCSAVVFVTSLSIEVATSFRASPNAVVPLALMSTIWNEARSVNGTICRAALSKVIMLM